MKMKLMFGDCLEKMQEIPDKSIGLILCDPPYGQTSCSWDKIIPFEQLWNCCQRIIKNLNPIVFFGCEPFSSNLRLSNLSRYKYDFVWIKNRPSGIMNAKLRPMSIHENIMIFSNGKTSNGNENNMNYFPQNLIRINRMTNSPSKPKLNAENSYARPSHKEKYFQEYGNYPTTILFFGKDEKEKFHPTQKPVELLEYLIKTYTTEGDTVLDFCFGSCSCGIACINTNRNFIGIEKSEHYFKVGKERVLKHIANRKRI